MLKKQTIPMQGQSQKPRPLDRLIQRIVDGSEDYVPPLPAKVVQGDFRPKIALDWRLVNDIAAELGQKLAKTGEIFVRDGVVIALNKSKRRFESIGAVRFVTWIEQFVVFQKFAGSGEQARLVDCSITKSLAELILESEGFKTALQEINRENRVRLPIVRSGPCGDPRIELLGPGYDPETRTYTFVDEEYDEQMPFHEACAFLNEILQDVAFDPADSLRSLSGVLAMVLTPYCDQLVDDAAARPAFVVTANRDGAGKTFLVKIALVPVYGMPSLTAPPAADKIQEVLNAVVRDGKPYLFLDNWRGEIGGPAIEAFISGPRWTGRILGQSATFDHEKRCLVFITGNNARLSSDGMRRRCIPINLFISEARSEDRNVKRPLEERDLIQLRGKALAAFWAIVRHWANGMYFWRGKQNRSYGEWGEVVGGIVQCICSNQSPLEAPTVSHDSRLQTWVRFLEWFPPDFRDEWTEYSALFDFACRSGIFEDLPENAADDSQQGRTPPRKTSFSKRYCQYYRNSSFNTSQGIIWFLENGEHGRLRRYMVTGTPPDNTNQP